MLDLRNPVATTPTGIRARLGHLTIVADSIQAVCDELNALLEVDDMADEFVDKTLNALTEATKQFALDDISAVLEEVQRVTAEAQRSAAVATLKGRLHTAYHTVHAAELAVADAERVRNKVEAEYCHALVQWVSEFESALRAHAAGRPPCAKDPCSLCYKRARCYECRTRLTRQLADTRCELQELRTTAESTVQRAEIALNLANRDLRDIKRDLEVARGRSA